MLYGELLKTIRKVKGYTQNEVAQGTHMSRSNYSRYETNLILMDDETLSYIAKFYETSKQDFIDWAKVFNSPEYPFNLHEKLYKIQQGTTN
ncbi:MAG: helix-turn-helix transcriptional regulator [Clostridia bacterium]